MKMDFPELLLDQLHTKVIQVLSAAEGLRGEENRYKKDKVITTLRNIIVMRTLWNTRAIAITGLQGAGKTSTLWHLLGSSDELHDYLPMSIGRDERLPILIREHNQKKISAGAIRVSWDNDTGLSMGEVEVPKNKFIDLARSSDPSVVMLTLRVPRTLFQDDEQAILLTPGIENSRDSTWESHVRKSLLSVSQIIWVVSPTQLASANSKTSLDDIISKMPGIRPLIIITHKDVEGPKFAEIEQTARERFNFEGGACEVVGLGNITEMASSWRSTVIKKIIEFGGTSKAMRIAQLESLIGILEEGIPDFLDWFKEKGQESLETQSFNDHVRISQIKPFDEQVSSLRRELEKTLDSKLESHTYEVQKVLEQKICDRSGWKTFMTWAFGFDLKDKIELDKTVADAWNAKGNGSKCIVDSIFIAAEVKGFNKKLLLHPSVGGQVRALLAEAGSQGKQPRPPSALELKEAENNLSHVELMRTIPVIATSMMAASAMAAIRTKTEIVDLNLPMANKEFLESTLASMKEGGESTRNTIFALFSMVGVADAADGNPSMLAGALNAAGATISPLVAGMVTAGIAIASTAVIVASVKRQMSRIGLELDQAARSMALAISSSAREDVLKKFDHLMEIIRERVLEALSERQGWDRSLNTAVATLAAVESAERVRLEVLSSARRSLSMLT